MGPTLPPTLLLDGRSLAAVGLQELARRIEARLREGQATPTLLAIASASDPSAPSTLRLKAKAAARAGVNFRAHLIGGDDSLQAILAGAAVDPDIHGIFVQWPAPTDAPPDAPRDATPGATPDATPDALEGHARSRQQAPGGATSPESLASRLPAPLPHPATRLLDVIPMWKDVDAVSPRSRRALAEGRPVHCPAEALAVVEALEGLGVDLRGTSITVVGGDDPTTLGILATLQVRGAVPECLAADDAGLREAVGLAGVLVTARAPAEGIPGAWLQAGAVVVDGGYMVPGGHLRLGPDTPRLTGMVPSRGGLGPLTILALLRNTLAAAGKGPQS